MGQRMTWDEIQKSYPDEWVAFDDYKMNGPLEVTGTVIAHDSHKQNFYKKVEKVRDSHPHIAVRFTGELVKNSEIPLLWQLSDTK